MNVVMAEKDIYLSDFDRLRKTVDQSEAPWLHELRAAAIERFAEVGFPTLRDEDWRFTNLAPLTRVPFQLAEPATVAAAAIRSAERRAFAGQAGHRLVFVNGFFAPALSTTGKLPGGVRVGNLTRILSEEPGQIEPWLAQYADSEDHPFHALNTAFFRDGGFVAIGPGAVLKEPIYIVHVSAPGREPSVSHPRTLIVAESGSVVTVMEAYVASHEGVYFTNALTEVVVHDGAMVDHYKLQRETPQAFHMASMQVHQARASRFSTHGITLGGGLTRNEIGVVLDGEGGESVLNGLYVGAGRQHIDNRTTIDHAQPRCASHELYKGILGGKAHGVFNGKIYVRQDAQKTDAKQTNQTLLLSDDATINTKPQLEIYADDVKCTHGATVGQLDPESLFYLRARGIEESAARNLLTFAFANDVVERIKLEPLRAGLEDHLLATQSLPADIQVQEAE